MKTILLLLAILAISVSGFAPNPSIYTSRPVSTKHFAESDPEDVPEVKVCYFRIFSLVMLNDTYATSIMKLSSEPCPKGRQGPQMER